MRWTIAWAALGVMTFAASAVWRRWRATRRSLEEMSRMAERLSQGDHAARVREILPRGLTRLGRALNRLAESVESSIAELDSEKTQLATILGNMVEAVVAVDSAGTIIALNEAMARLFSIAAAAAVGKPFLEVARQTQLADVLQRTLRDRKPVAETVTLFAPEERSFECHAVALSRNGDCTGALLVLHEITRLRKLEQMRKEFVANVSHELRTPLASIKGFAESLQSGAMEDPELRSEFVASIEQEADRMARLVDDLLDLAAVESGRRPPALEPVSLQELAKSMADNLKPLADRRKVAIKVEAADVPLVRADRRQIQQVFTNLLDNAVKFNRDGGRVTVSVKSRGGEASVEIEDTGIGIPEADLPRVFERFYRVDKARSRDLGGTGLGLSIVKHIVEAHGGAVSVASVEGKGTAFRFTLPI